MIAVTSRRLCRRDFLEQMELVARGSPEMVILREKDLPEEELMRLASDVWHICLGNNVPMSVNGSVRVARWLDTERVHVPLKVLREEDLGDFHVVGTSVHSVEEAVEAEALGADYVIAGHVFPTACKLGLEPRGTEFIRRVCGSVTIPVYAIGGITPDNAESVYDAGAFGVCSMSSVMTAEDPADFISRMDLDGYTAEDFAI